MLIKKYNPQWADGFNSIMQILEDGLSDLQFKIEHIGSTSVINLAAKPIIDIDIIYYKDEEFLAVKERLENLGYYHNGNQGIKDREAFKRPYLDIKNKVLDNINHHLYVCPSYSVELQRHLNFRNYLNKHKSARKQYEKIKYAISLEAGHDKNKYAKLKELKAKAFIENILKKASKIKTSKT